MSNRILDYPEATAITSDDYILLDNEGTGAKCIKASALNINMDNYTIKEARGAIASFDDGEDLPLAFMGAYITALQDLHGYDYPWVGGAGKNKANPDLLLDGYTNPSNRKYADTDMAKTQFVKTEGLSTITISATNGNRCYVCYYNNIPNVGDEALTNVMQVATSLPQTITVDSSYTYVAIQICYNTSGANVSNVQVESGSTATTFAPYSNECPIIGWSAVDVTRTGKNVFGGLQMAENIVEVGRNATLDTTNKTVTFTSSLPKDGSYERSISEGYKFKENTIYTFIVTYSNSGNNGSLRFRNTTGTNQEITLANTNGQKTKIAVIMWSDFSLKDIILSFYAASSTTLYYEESGLFEGVLTADDFEPYNGNTYSLTFTDGTNPLTVYGGTVDLVSGVLTVDKGYVDLGTLDWQYSSISERFYVGASDLGVKATDASTPFNAISSALIAKSYNEIDAKTVDNAIGINPNATQLFARCSSITSASDFITAMNGVQLVYELATPLTYQLSKQQIRSLVGENNIFADTGDSIVDYRKLWVKPEM